MSDPENSKILRSVVKVEQKVSEYLTEAMDDIEWGSASTWTERSSQITWMAGENLDLVPRGSEGHKKTSR